MPITFNDRWANVRCASYYQASSGTYTNRGTLDNVYNVDVFPDTGVAVGDAFVIGINRNFSGKSNAIRFNLDLGVSAATWDGVWEYAYGGSDTVPNWGALTGVVDGSDKLRNTGSVTVEFDVPDDWDNYHLTNNSGLVYSFLIRFRVTSVSGLTEGGHIANISNNFQARGYTIYVSGYTDSSPCTFTEIYNASVSGGWGVVEKNGNQFVFNCNLVVDANCVLNMTQEHVQFNRNWFMQNPTSSKFNIGQVYSGDKVYRGGSIIFIGRNACYPVSTGLFGVSNVYNATIRHVEESGSFALTGYWGGGLGSATGATAIDVFLEGFRHLTFENSYFGCKGIKSTSRIEPGNGVIVEATIFSAQYGWRYLYTTIVRHVHKCDFSSVTVAPLSAYLTNNSNNTTCCVDCNFGTFAYTNYVYWQSGSGYNNQVLIISSLLLRVADRDGLPLSGASVVIKDKDGNTVFTGTTNADGYVGAESGTVTGATSNTLSDASKSWTQNQWRFREVFITSGSGAGQRRYIPAQASAPYTTLPIFPNWQIIPASGDRYIIVHYLNMIRLRPLVEGSSSSVWSAYDLYFPMTLTVSKAGYTDYTAKLEPRPGGLNLEITMSPGPAILPIVEHVHAIC